MTPVMRAIAKQVKLEDEATEGPWGVESTQSEPVDRANAALIAHLRNQAALASEALAAAEVFLNDFLSKPTCVPGALQRALAAWADHVNGETP